MTATDRHPVLTPLPGEGELGLVDALAQLSFAIQGALGRIAAANDASIVQARLLGILRDRSPTINELASLLQLDKSSVTGLIDRATERGLVARMPSVHDRRSVRVSITDRGSALIGGAHAAFEDAIAELVVELSASERSQLSRVATRIVEADARRRGIDIFQVEETSD
jgi:MarR family transcriptional regulator, lower aerobic nicotinate degradation pathway regulator